MGVEDDDANSGAFELDPQELPKPSAPLWAWALLVAAVCAVSSAGVVFSLIADVPPITLAAWRLQLTSVFLGVGAVLSWRRMSGEDRQRTLQQGGLLAASGTCLCVHFGCWVYSVEATSLTHSLLFVSATPLFLAGGAWLLRHPISRGELGGTALGAVGAVLLATAAARTDAQVTVRGDMAALLASLCFVGYLLIGRKLRAWMPVMVYAFCVTGLAASMLTLGSLLFEGAGLAVAGKGGAFGWAASKHYLPFILYLAVVPGIVGHTGFNTLLKYLNPLVISLACNLEPLIGSLLGWAIGVVAGPGPWTFVGGALVMASTFVVCVSAHLREKEAAGKQAASRAVHRIMSGTDEEGRASGMDGEAWKEDAEAVRLVRDLGGSQIGPGAWEGGSGSARQGGGGSDDGGGAAYAAQAAAGGWGRLPSQMDDGQGTGHGLERQRGEGQPGAH